MGDRQSGLIAVQEIPGSGVRLDGYTVHPKSAGDTTASGRCRSAVLVREGLPTRAIQKATLLDALGSYVAGVEVQFPSGWIPVYSVHASPSLVGDDLPDVAVNGRECETGPWWSDVAAAGLIEAAADGSPVIAPGDYNECRRWDDDHPGHTCGYEFFIGLSNAGIGDCTSSWNPERATRQNPPYQVDRVFADERTCEHIAVRDEMPSFDGLSDHAPIWFEIDL
jgi:endonuclease/exonuclease/phosphatase family metal-dependent hydrolase